MAGGQKKKNKGLAWLLTCILAVSAVFPQDGLRGCQCRRRRRQSIEASGYSIGRGNGFAGRDPAEYYKPDYENRRAEEP